MTETMRAWRKANAYARSGQHEKGIHWFLRTQEILDAGPPRRFQLKTVGPERDTKECGRCSMIDLADLKHRALELS